MIQQIQTVCPDCRGQGERINPKDRCKQCQGKKVTRERKILEVHVKKGMSGSERIVFNGEGDQEPDLAPGDIIIILDEKEHPLFKRSGIDLVYRQEILLVEALCGFKKVIRTLDGRDLLFVREPGEVTKHGEIKCILKEGMPHYKNPTEKGRLIVQFFVTFPDTIAPEVIPTLEDCLPPRTEVMISDQVEEVELLPFDAKEEARTRQSKNVYDEDEDGHGPGQRVQCSTN